MSSEISCFPFTNFSSIRLTFLTGSQEPLVAPLSFISVFIGICKTYCIVVSIYKILRNEKFDVSVVVATKAAPKPSPMFSALTIDRQFGEICVSSVKISIWSPQSGILKKMFGLSIINIPFLKSTRKSY